MGIKFNPLSGQFDLFTPPGAAGPVEGDAILSTGESAGLVLTSDGADGASWEAAAGGGVWGSITGTLSAQTDLNTALGLKAPLAGPTFTGTTTVGEIVVSGLTTNTAVVSNGFKELESIATTDTELTYVHGVTSAIQTQLDAKAPFASPTFTGAVEIPDGLEATPGLRLTSEQSGLYYIGAGQLGVSLAGRKTWRLRDNSGHAQLTGYPSDASHSMVISHGSSAHDGTLVITGDGGIGSGGEIDMYGDSHATLASQIIFRNAGNTSATASALGAWNFVNTVGASKLEIGAAASGGSSSSTVNYTAVSQNGSTISEVANTNAGPSAAAILKATSALGTISLQASSSANETISRLNSASAFTGGLVINQIGTNPISLRTNSVERIGISGAGAVSFASNTASTVPYLDASKVLTSSDVTPTELGYVSGVTSAIQTQLTAKAPTASATFTGYIKFGNYHVEPVLYDAGNSGAAITLDLSQGNVIKVTLNNATPALTLSNPQSGAAYRLMIVQDGTGSRVASFVTSINWGALGAPTLSTTASKKDFLDIWYDGSNYYGMGYVLGY